MRESGWDSFCGFARGQVTAVICERADGCLILDLCD